MTDPAGLLEKGNIDLLHRPVVKNDDGTISTVRSMSFEEDGAEILVPTVSPDGRVLSDDDAIALYHQSGQHLGKFRTPEEASSYAEQLHEDQANLYGNRPKQDPWRGWRLPDAAQLPRSVAPGPQTWGEAWGEAAQTTDTTIRVIENSNADYYALEKAYDERIAAIREITGQELPNPMRVASGVDRDMAAIAASQAGAAGFVPGLSVLSPDYLQRQESEFNERARSLSGQYRQEIDQVLSSSIAEDRNRVMRDAEKGASDAAQSPELGFFGRLSAQLAGGLMGSARDPMQVGMAVISAGGATAETVAGRIGKTILQEALLNGGQEAVLQAASQERKKAAGLEHGMEDALKNIGIAATFGALFGGTMEGAGELWRSRRARGAAAPSGSASPRSPDAAASPLVREVSDEEGIAATARVMEGKPEPGDVELVAQAMDVELGPERLDLLNRSFEDRVLDDVMVPPDASPEQIRVLEAAQRYAEDPDNNPPPELVERLLADEEAARTQFSPDQYERMFAGDQNAIDDIGDTFFGGDLDKAAARIDAASERVEAVASRLEQKVRGFQTEKGSTYVVEGQTTTRNKAARDLPGHEGDFGGKPASALTIYVDENAGALSAAGLSGMDARGARVALKDGRATLVTWNNEAGGWGASEGSRNIPYHLEPAVGRYPLELWNAADDVPGYSSFSKMHAGNKIVSVVEDVPDAIQGQTIKPPKPVEPFDDAAMVQAAAQAGDIVEPARDQNGNPENYLDFVGVEDGDGNIKVMSTAEALTMAEEPEFFADLLESCKL